MTWKEEAVDYVELQFVLWPPVVRKTIANLSNEVEILARNSLKTAYIHNA